MRHFTVVLMLGLPPLAAGAQSRPAPEALARSLQQRYEGIKDFSADFVHTYRGGVLRQQAKEQGTVTVKKPGRMRWNYTAPEKKLFVSDGAKIYSYIPQDKQVMVANVPASNEATTPAMFLAGKGDIARDFKASYADGRIVCVEAGAAPAGAGIRVAHCHGGPAVAPDPRADDVRHAGRRVDVHVQQHEGKPGSIR